MTTFLSKNRRWVVWGSFALIMLVGAAFRFQALRWDQGQYFHPDERAIVNYTELIGQVPLTWDHAYGPHKRVEMFPGGLSFFLPNDKANLRPATRQEAELYEATQRENGAYQLPVNVLPPGQAPPDEAINFWNAGYSPINPRWFAYGSLPMYLIKFGGHVVSAVTGQVWYDYDHLMLIGRALSGLWSMGTLVLVFFLSRTVFGPSLGRARGEAIGLLAMAFLAVAVLDIQLAHYAAFDVTMTFFITLSLYLAVRLMRSGRRTTAIGLGAAIGLALACKISAAPVVLAAGVAALLYGLYGHATESGEFANRRRRAEVEPEFEEADSGQPSAISYDEKAQLDDSKSSLAIQNHLSPNGEKSPAPEGVKIQNLLSGTVLNLVLAGLTALVVWFVTMPYAFLDFIPFIMRVGEEAGMSRGVDSFPYTRQYVGTTPFLYQASNLLQWGVGIPLGLLALAGLFFSCWRGITRRLKAELVLLSFLLPYCLITFSAEAKFNRYMLPILPILVILAARLIVEVVESRKSKVEISYNPKSPVPEGVKITRPRMGKNPKSLLAGGVAAFALAWGFVWALSFSQIYSVEHPMNQATRWMFQNMPGNVSISNEYWDEGLPTRIMGQSASAKGWCDREVLEQGGACQSVQMDLYGDAPHDQKVDYFVNQLRKTDYILIASNRLYATMPKLPWRYPIQMRYYELLFENKLGYEKVGEFTAYPKIPLLDLEIRDDGADESFTVYDHPKVFIFKKTKPLTDDEVRGLFLNATKTPWVPKRYPGPNDLPTRIAGQGDGVLDSATAGQVREQGKTLLLDRPVDRLPIIDDIGWNKLANANQWLAFGLWFVLIQLLGLVALPVAWRVCRRLPDRGYILAKPLGAVSVALVIWLLVWTRFFMNTAWTAWLALGLMAAFAGWLGWRNRVELGGWLKANRRLILWEEGLFLAVYVAWVLFRLGNPDLWHPFFGGEKPMEMTHLQGILKSAYFPPYDPWFADGHLNYYYFGQYLVSTWIKLSGINPYIAFNLALPILYAFTCTAAFSLVFNLAAKYKQHRARFDQAVNPDGMRGPVAAGFFGVVIFAFVGNLDGFVQLLQRFQPMTDLANSLGLYPDKVEVLRKFDYFRSSRVIPGTINEFPAFSFIYADLHAHLVALPYTLVAMALSLNLMSTDWQDYRENPHAGFWRSLWQMTGGRLWQVFDRTLVTPVIIMTVIGFLGATNSWDLPTYLLVVAASVFVALFRRYLTQPITEIEPDENETEQDQFTSASNDNSKLITHNSKLTVPSLLIDLVLTALVLGATLGGALGLYWNFFGRFQAFFTQIALLPDRLPTWSYRDTEITTISGRTETRYFIVIFALPLLLILSYLLWNCFDWWRSSRPGPRPFDYDDYEDGDYGDEEEWADATESERQPSPVRQQTLPGFGLKLKRPELAFSLAGAGADGGSEGSFGSGPGFGGSSPQMPGKSTGRLARTTLLVLAFFSFFVLVVGLAAPNNWFVFALAATFMAACLVLTFVRPFDPTGEQAAEASNPGGLFMRIMLLAGFGIVGATELVYLKDDMGGEYTRMNTVFKFYYQVWGLLCLAGAFGAYVLWTRWIAPRMAWQMPARRTVLSQGLRFGWIGVVVVLLFCVGLYPVQAIPTRLSERGSNPPPQSTLDGRAYFKTLNQVMGMPNMVRGKVFDLTYDAQSVFEFYDKVKGTPVVLQASIWPYRGGGSFIPINTGLPTVLGWDHHSRQQRWPDMVSDRSGSGGEYGKIRQIYTTPSIQDALNMLNHYHVTYLHIGTIEREAEFANERNESSGSFMSEEGYVKFEQMAKLGLLEVAYQNPGVIIYKITPKGESGVIPSEAAANAGINVVDPKLRRLEDAVKAAPSSAQAHYNLGQYWYARREFTKAAQSLETVIKLEPGRVNPYHVLGDIYRDGGNEARALEVYRKATEVAVLPDEIPPAFNKYGVALQQVGRFEEALVQFDEVIRLNRFFNEAYFHKGEVYEAQSKKDLASAAYQQAIANSQRQDDFWSKRANQKIRELAGR